jgi:hypothetical protein
LKPSPNLGRQVGARGHTTLAIWLEQVTERWWMIGTHERSAILSSSTSKLFSRISCKLLPTLASTRPSSSKLKIFR